MGVFSCHEAIRREAFFETGGFHPEYTKDTYIGDGETGLNRDIIKNGWLMSYVGQSIIYHMIPAKRMTQKHINKVMANNGNAVSYGEYRKNPFDKSGLKMRKKEYFRAYIEDCKVILMKSLQRESSLRFIIAKACYYKSREKYDARVVKDENFREMVMTNNWLK